MIDEPKWVSYKYACVAHQKQIDKHGGLEGVRDEGLLLSALARPKNLYHWSEPKPSLSEIAAAYAYGIARNHAFIDGNKRTASVVCRLFLRMNGLDIVAEESDEYRVFMAVAVGEMTQAECAAWIASKVMVLAESSKSDIN